MEEDSWEADPSTVPGLRELVETQRDLLTAIATGTMITPTYQAAYRRRRTAIRGALRSRGLEDPFKWPDLHHWWAHAKQWATYAERRAVVAESITPLLDKLDDLERSGRIDDWGGSPDHWTTLEERLAGLRQEMDSATTLDHFQDVGRRGREILIATVNGLFEKTMVPDGKEQPKGADVKARFDYIVQRYAAGKAQDRKSVV